MRNKQPNYTFQKAEAKIRKCEKVKNGLYALGIAGFISVIGSVAILQEYNKPEIVKTYRNAKTAVQRLQHKRNDLNKGHLDFSYQNQEVEEAIEFFKKKYNEGEIKLDKAIKSTEIKISKIESMPEFEQYQQNKKTKIKASYGMLISGFLASFSGGIGGLIFSRKKRDLEKILDITISLTSQKTQR